jgi:hypothetical protein
LTKGVTGEIEFAGKEIIEKIKAAEAKNSDFNSQPSHRL